MKNIKIDKNYKNIQPKYISINNLLISLKNIPKYVYTIDNIIDNLNSILKLQNNPHVNTITYKNYYIIYNHKLLSKNTILNQFIHNNTHINNNIIYLNVIEKLHGGAGILDMFFSIIDIANFFLKLGDIISWFFKFVWWLIKFTWWFFTDLLDPRKLMSEFYNSLITIIIAICRLPFDVGMGFISMFVNLFGGWMQGFWGWDQSSLTKNDRDSNYFRTMNRRKNSKCYLTNTDTVPFSIILGTILCPPIGVFMEMGLTGWLNILICILLTLLFYVPGLIYALVIIYS